MAALSPDAPRPPAEARGANTRHSDAVPLIASRALHCYLFICTCCRIGLNNCV